MAENLSKVPKRGILKASTSFEQRDHPDHHQSSKNPHFDEMNILATFHPADKDYGFMKIEEPKTPYEYASGEEDEDETEGKCKDSEAKHSAEELDANLLASRIAAEGLKGPRPRRVSEPSRDEEDLQLLSPEERERWKKFEQKRKAHYNEFYAAKMARQLMEEEDDEEEETKSSNGSKDATSPNSPGSSSAAPDIDARVAENSGSATSPMDTADSLG